jgi:hypothetical protein
MVRLLAEILHRVILINLWFVIEEGKIWRGLGSYSEDRIHIQILYPGVVDPWIRIRIRIQEPITYRYDRVRIRILPRHFFIGH